MNGNRTKRAKDARKALIERFGKDRHASFIEVATDLITNDRLFADLPKDREHAIRFLDTYWALHEFGKEIKPLPDGVTLKSMAEL
jgi:hypothetical protein